MSRFMTIFFVNSLMLQIFNAAQLVFDPIIVNDIFNLAMYAYMGQLMLVVSYC
jgi:hypothetical protein